ncbi:MAG: LysR family transcriptional regulator [Chromatiales bacterium]|nr:LysR family transcriptional regulator [Chromatiales bacterium]
MRHLNYEHLRYFWTVARLGSITEAAAELHLAPQTISGQIKLLEAEAPGPLLERSGRRLVLTDLGRTVAAHADEIFSRGQELSGILRGAAARGLRQLSVGVSDAMPKLVTWRILKPVFDDPPQVRVACREAELSRLLGDLAAHRCDLLLTTHPVGAETGMRVSNHLLGESDLVFFAAPALARKLRSNFPGSLNGAPWLMPSEGTQARRILDGWCTEQDITPLIVGEFDDSGLKKTFGQAGLGVFTAPAAIRREIESQYKVRAIGTVPELRARYYAITAARRSAHPDVQRILSAAGDGLL